MKKYGNGVFMENYDDVNIGKKLKKEVKAEIKDMNHLWEKQ